MCRVYNIHFIFQLADCCIFVYNEINPDKVSWSSCSAPIYKNVSWCLLFRDAAGVLVLCSFSDCPLHHHTSALSFPKLSNFNCIFYSCLFFLSDRLFPNLCCFSPPLSPFKLFYFFNSFCLC